MKIIIVYGSTTGNTEMMSHLIGNKLRYKYPELHKFNVATINPEELTDYDCIIFGSSTWGAGELQDDFIVFEQELGKIDLSGKIGAVFGCSETAYPLFCEAVNILENTITGCGVSLIIEPLKVDGDVLNQEYMILRWADTLLKQVNAFYKNKFIR